MKITKFAIAFVVILLPLLVINNIHLSKQRLATHLEMQYNAALDAATKDAAKAMTLNADQEFEAGYGSDKKYRANKEEAIKAFFNTLDLNFNIGVDGEDKASAAARGTIEQYVPVVAVIDYDGYYLYVPQEYTDSDGQTLLKHMWTPKKPYSWSDDQGNSIGFTLDDYVVTYDHAANHWEWGKVQDLKDQHKTGSIPLLQEPNDEIDKVRRTAIINLVQKDLEYYINTYNNQAKRYGIAYTFTLPTIPQEQWNNTISDIGVIAFLQGIPMGDKFYNNYALGGSRIFRKPVFYGSTVNGVKYYYKAACQGSMTPEETFSSEKEAALKGYHPLECGNNK